MRKVIAVTTAALVLLALSCGEDETPPQQDWSASPDAVLNAVEKSFNERDHGLLKYSLDHDAFVFYFNPQDVGSYVGGYIIPESWTYAEFYQACGNMFDEAYEISLQIPPIGAPPEGATTFIAYNVTINLLVMTDEENGYRADKGYCNFKFKKFIENGEVRWRLVQWWDFSIAYDGGGRSSPTSFGRILVMFR